MINDQPSDQQSTINPAINNQTTINDQWETHWSNNEIDALSNKIDASDLSTEH